MTESWLSPQLPSRSAPRALGEKPDYASSTFNFQAAGLPGSLHLLP